MKFRPQRGGLEDAMKEMVEVDGLAGLIEHIRKEHQYLREISPNAWRIFEHPKVTAEPYGSGRDDRIGWKDTHIVLVEEWGPVGFCEGAPAPQNKPKPSPKALNMAENRPRRPKVSRRPPAMSG